MNGRRFPATCPAGFRGHYTVAPGDTMFTIAQRFRVRLQTLIAVNPHIPNPNLIFPGDVLCVPGQIPFPCCLVLNPVGAIQPGVGGAAFANINFMGTQSINVVANLPCPMTIGNFNSYTAEVRIPGIDGFGNELFPTPEEPPTWATSIDLPTAASLTPGSMVLVMPLDTRTGASGPVILEGSLDLCR